jgi:hypothetical protein
MAEQPWMYGAKKSVAVPPKPQKKIEPEEKPFHWQPSKKSVYWPTAFGVKTADGHWLCIYVDRRHAEKVFAEHPEAKYLYTELDTLMDEEDNEANWGRVEKTK